MFLRKFVIDSYVEEVIINSSSSIIFIHNLNQIKSGMYFLQLEEGQKVSFDLVDGDKGPQAENITAL